MWSTFISASGDDGPAADMRLWIPLSLLGIVMVAYAFFYLLSWLEQQGANSFVVVNTVGLLAVVLGVVAAVAILRRAAPP